MSQPFSGRCTVYIVNTTPENSSFSWELLIAFVAIIVAPLIQYRIAKKQIHASTVTANRQDWINNLRNLMAEFDSVAFEILPKKTYNDGSVDMGVLMTSISKLKYLLKKINLFLNPTEENAQKIIQTMNDILLSVIDSYDDDINKRKINGERFAEQQKEFIIISQIILKEEWERVKRGD